MLGYYSVGDNVIYKDSWGEGEEKKARIISIHPNKYTSLKLRHSETSMSNDRVFSLDNGHWCYGYQIKRSE